MQRVTSHRAHTVARKLNHLAPIENWWCDHIKPINHTDKRTSDRSIGTLM
jgi:hypothetical protein